MHTLSHINEVRSLQDQDLCRSDLIKALSAVVKNRDEYTANHNHRVGEIAALIAHTMGLSTQEVQMIYEAGSLHDIGKLAIPLSSIYKPSALSVEEYDEIKRHPEWGVKILQYFPSLVNLTSGVLYHHERYDGSGYPFGLRGEQIPICARIIALADTFDAMTSDRSYRNGLGIQKALNELKLCANAQLDPEIVKISLNVLENFYEELREDLDHKISG